jgi:RNA polymerase sigma-70 factor, ECF subfamily
MIGRPSSAGDAIPSSTSLLEAHIPGLQRFARALLRGDQDRADDLVQDTLERALSRWHQRRSDGNLRNWLYTILFNRFLTEKRRWLRHKMWVSSMSAIVDGDFSVLDGGQDRALAHRDLLRGFAKIPAGQRAVLFLIGVEDFTYAEAAGVLDIPIGTVMSRLSRGRERLRQYMEGNCAQTRFSAVHVSDLYPYYGRISRKTEDQKNGHPTIVADAGVGFVGALLTVC